VTFPGVQEAPSDTHEEELAALLAGVAHEQMQPLWTQVTALLTPTPRTEVLPWLWSGERMRALAAEAGRLVPVERGGDRRVLSMSNPGLGGLPFATKTLWGAVQYLGGREVAPAHRHTPGAIRFVLQGEGVWTTVNGDSCAMSSGDLVLTPGWNWHEHHNESDEPMMWFDGLDLPMTAFFDAVFFEEGDEDGPADRSTPVVSTSERIHGYAGIRPEGVVASDQHSPLLAYRWAQIDAALTALTQREPEAPSVTVTFVDPRNGADALPTARCQMTRLVPGRRTPTTRTVGSSILVCYSGHGRTVMNGTAYDWKAGDVVVVPSWAALDHQAEEPSDLFVFSDAPAVEALKLARTTVSTQPQPITAVFDGTAEEND
jgi:gentisate 1,2-dioxygenase